MTAEKPAAARIPLLRIAVSVVLLVLAAWLLGTHWQTVYQGLILARGASLPWVVLSLILMAFTFCLAAAIYGTLALYRLHYRQTLVVEVATAFVNRLLPAGIGGLGLHGIYLYRRNHTTAEATAVVSVNNLLGMAAHLLALTVVLTFRPEVVRGPLQRYHFSVPWTALFAVLAVIVLVALLPPVRAKAARFGRNLLSSVRQVRLAHVARGFGLASLLTLTYTLILASSAHSVGIHLNLLQLFIVFSAGMFAGTVTPTPGGLVGMEAGLFAGFVAYGVAVPLATVAVLLFRLVSYWLPLVPGVIALLYARHRHFV